MLEQKVENQSNQYVLKTEETIDRELIEFIFKHNYPPLDFDNLLQAKDKLNQKLIQSIPKEYFHSFKKLLNKVQEYRLTQEGLYYGSLDEKEYIAFSQCIFMYAIRKNKMFDEGFIYLKDSNCYKGEIHKGRAQGNGQAIFFKDQGEESFRFQFKGKWKDGQIEEGNNKIYQLSRSTFEYELVVEYEGKFQEFNFHGDGKRIIHGEEEKIEDEGRFRNGSLIEEQLNRLSYIPPEAQ